jgi:hypothetical protein
MREWCLEFRPQENEDQVPSIRQLKGLDPRHNKQTRMKINVSTNAKDSVLAHIWSIAHTTAFLRTK